MMDFGFLLSVPFFAFAKEGSWDWVTLYSIAAFGLTLVMMLAWVWKSYLSTSSVFLVDFKVFQAPDSWKCPTERYFITGDNFGFSPELQEFQMKMLRNSGLGEETSFPPGILSNPPDLSMASARKEAEIVMFTCLDALFADNGIKPSEVDILIVNCSLFCPTPSLSAMIVNHYKMREDIQSYNLGGMGCSAGLISLHLARDLLYRYPKANCVIVSTENITQNIYTGLHKNMMVQNALFRVGGAAVLVSNNARRFGRCSKMLVQDTLRSHLGSDNEAYSCVFQDVDSEGVRGVRLGKEVMQVAARALTKNITRLSSRILPLSEIARYLFHEVRRFLRKKFVHANKKNSANGVGSTPSSASVSATMTVDPRDRTYVPDFTKAVDHFCLHAGGRGVLDALQKSLSLSDHYMAPSRYALRAFGNTSSASVWYELHYIWNTDGLLKANDLVWQIGFGSGFKCNSSILRACRSSRKGGESCLARAKEEAEA